MNSSRNKIQLIIKILKSESIITSLILVFILMIVIFYLINPLFLSLENVKGFLVNITTTGIVAMGVAVVMISGNFDVSIGATIAATSIVVAKLYYNLNIPIPFTILIGLSVGIIIGAFNGFLVTVVGVNSIIVTLGTLTMLRGITYFLANEPIEIKDKILKMIGRAYVLRNIPITFIYMILLFIVIYLILRFTKFGRDIYSSGANANVSRLYGVKVKKTQFICFMISGFTAAIGGIIMLSQVGLAYAGLAVGYEFRILTICILGGISLYGGRGPLVGVILATFIIGTILSGLIFAGISSYWLDAFQGTMLIIVILIDSLRNKRIMMVST